MTKILWKAGFGSENQQPNHDLKKYIYMQQREAQYQIVFDLNPKAKANHADYEATDTIRQPTIYLVRLFWLQWQ